VNHAAVACALAGIVLTFAVTCIFIILEKQDENRRWPPGPAPDPAAPRRYRPRHCDPPDAVWTAGRILTRPPDAIWQHALHREPGAPALPAGVPDAVALLARVRDKLRDLPPRQPDDTRPDLPAVPPDTCGCTRLVVATLEETLSCPAGWRYAPGIGWLHPIPARWS